MTVALTVRAADLAHWDVTRDRWVVESSTHDLLVGASSTDIRQWATLQVRGETIPPRDLSRPTRAENFDGYAGVLLADESKQSGTVVAGAGWISFADAALDAGADTFTATVANPGAGTGAIEIRLDSPTGPLVGTATVPSTGDIYAYTTTSAPLSGATGRRDVYLVLDQGLRLATFTLD